MISTFAAHARSLCRRAAREGTTSESRRVVFLGRSDLNAVLGDNRVTNTRFTAATFFPIMLYDQFSTPMALYFLLIATLQLWRTIAPVHPMTSWAPLIVVFLVTCVKEALDDRKRRAADDAANARPYAVWSRGTLKPACASQDICVGDLVRVGDGEEVPCDLLLLRVADSCPGGAALVETANLDGETDLKPRRALPELQALRVEDLAGLQGRFECEPPNPDLYRFEASLQLLGSRGDSSPGLVGELSVGREQLLQGGALVRRSGWVVGVAVYTGAHTKLSLNKSAPKQKVARADRTINASVVVIFAAQALLVAALGWLGLANASYESAAWWYLGWPAPAPRAADADAQAAALWSVWQADSAALLPAPPPPLSASAPWYAPLVLPLRFLLLSSMMIPISLRVSMDLVKAFYALTIASDPALARRAPAPAGAPPGAKPPLLYARVANSAIAEDLGLVSHVLTDKTGTLTENVMVLRALALPGREFGCLGGGDGDAVPAPPPQAPAANPAGATRFLRGVGGARPEEHEAADLLPDGGGGGGRGGSDSGEFLSDESAPARANLWADPVLEGALTAGDDGVCSMLLALALCNCVAPEHSDALPLPGGAADAATGAAQRMRRVQFASSNPDEEALVHGAARLGVALTHRAVLAGGVQRLRVAFSQPAAVRTLAAAAAASLRSRRTSVFGGGGGGTASASASGVSSPLGRAVPLLPAVLGLGGGATSPPRGPSEPYGDDVLGAKLVWVSDAVPTGAYDVLAVLEFTSERKRMSVVVRCVEGCAGGGGGGGGGSARPALAGAGTGLWLITKGADDVVIPRLAPGQEGALDSVLPSLERFAARGLRTLLVGARRIAAVEWESWKRRWDAACGEVGEGRATAVAEVCEWVEHGLSLVGATAIEDKLQAGVSDAMAALREAGVRVWMLTGDKASTALQISRSARLLPPHSAGTTLLHLSGASQEGVETELEEARALLRAARAAAGAPQGSGIDAEPPPPPPPRQQPPPTPPAGDALLLPVTPARSSPASSTCSSLSLSSLTGGAGEEAGAATAATDDWALLVEGRSLRFILAAPRARDLFFSIARRCSAIVACRCTPAQKAALVTALREFLARAGGGHGAALAARAHLPLHYHRRAGVVLAIGDGGNDVAMIQSADVGVGVLGREGTQAARAADFALGSFSLLPRLLLVHGRQSLHRTALVAQYTMYKSMLICFLQLAFNGACAASGCSLLDAVALTNYNLLLTAAPTLLMVLDSDLPPPLLLAKPALYRGSAAGDWLTRRTVAGWALRGVGQALIIYGVATAALGGGGGPRGEAPDQGLLSNVAYTAIVALQSVAMYAEMHAPNALNAFFCAACLAIQVATLAVRSFTDMPGDGQGMLQAMNETAGPWLAVALAAVAAALPWLAWGAVARIEKGRLAAQLGARGAAGSSSSSSSSNGSSDGGSRVGGGGGGGGGATAPQRLGGGGGGLASPAPAVPPQGGLRGGIKVPAGFFAGRRLSKGLLPVGPRMGRRPSNAPLLRFAEK